MLTLKGTLVNVFTTPKKTNKEGEEYGGQDKIQLLGDLPLENGESRKDLITLTCHDAEVFGGLTGVEIELPVGVMSPAKGQIVFYIPKRFKMNNASAA